MIYILIIILFIACLLFCHIERSEISLVEILRCTQNDTLFLCHIEQSEISLFINMMQLVLPTGYYYDANGNHYIANIWRKRPRLCPETLSIQSQSLTNPNPLYV